MIPSTSATPVLAATKIDPPAHTTTGPQPFDAQGRLSREALDWVDTQALEPSRSAPWASGTVSAGLFAYLNSGNAEVADRYFNRVRTGVAGHQDLSIPAQALTEKLAGDGMRPVVDMFPALDGDADRTPPNMTTHATLSGMWGDVLVRQHPLGGSALLQSRIDELQPGQCMLLFVNANGLAVTRDSEQLWVFDTTLNPGQDVNPMDPRWLRVMQRLEPHRFVEGAFGGRYPKCVCGEAAQSLLAAYLQASHTQALLVTQQPPAAGLPANA